MCPREKARVMGTMSKAFWRIRDAIRMLFAKEQPQLLDGVDEADAELLRQPMALSSLSLLHETRIYTTTRRQAVR
jgi:hypothetical protein